jgi:hypothetical protein
MEGGQCGMSAAARGRMTGQFVFRYAYMSPLVMLDSALPQAHTLQRVCLIPNANRFEVGDKLGA